MSSRNHGNHRWLILKLLNSIWLGILLIVAILVYSTLGSAIPGFRQAFELTEFQYFNHWIFVTLIGLLCLNLIVVTACRIRFKLSNAGVLTVHAGLLILCAGSVVYFGGKVEGNVRLEAPRIYVLARDRIPRRPAAAIESRHGRLTGADTGETPVPQVLADTGETPVPQVLVDTGEKHVPQLFDHDNSSQSAQKSHTEIPSMPDNALLDSFAAVQGRVWETDVPALGGRYRIKVTDVRHRGMVAASSVTLDVTVGNEPPRRIELDQSTVAARFKAINDKIVLLLVGATVADVFHDDSTPQLRTIHRDQVTDFQLPSLPYYKERFLPDVGPIQNSRGDQVHSKRRQSFRPLEHWEMPIRLGVLDPANVADTAGIAGTAERPIEK